MENIISWFRECFTDEAILSAIGVTFRMAFFACLISSVSGIAFGLMLERFNFKGKKLIIRLNRTLMGMPPVVAGLVVYLLLMRRGPLGMLGWLFTIKGMVMAQCLIIVPVMTGMVHQHAVSKVPAIREFCITMGADRRQTLWTIIKEMRHDIYFCVVTCFGRSISEVGSVMLVGGNIKGRTRTMTTAISLLKSQGIFTEGVALGLVLLVMAFIIQWFCDFLQKEESADENY
ncbi:MAG: ABC transporter permease [Firmicutes bacterium]|nr:ABC transporter permease [Bacillota bacterium]